MLSGYVQLYCYVCSFLVLFLFLHDFFVYIHAVVVHYPRDCSSV